jgi:molecular chaperone DnaK
MAVGIDLGNTYSVVAAVEGGRPVIIPNAGGGRAMPVERLTGKV